MTLEFVVITTGRFGSVERTLIITEALHIKVACFFGYSWYFRILHINFSVKPISRSILLHEMPIIINIVIYCAEWSILLKYLKI